MAFTKQQTIIGVIVLALVGIYLYKNKKTKEEPSGKDESSSGGGGGGGVGASNLSPPEVVVAPPIPTPPIVVPFISVPTGAGLRGTVVRGTVMPVLNFNPSITPPPTTQVIQNAQATQSRGANGGDYYSATKDGYYS